MKVDFFNSHCRSFSSKRKFGICDDPSPAHTPAYIKEDEGEKWIAVVDNHYGEEIQFIAVDNCISLKRESGEDAQRCDGFLFFNKTIIFVELKDRKGKQARQWKNEAKEQLKETIHFFEQQDKAKQFEVKKAYISNRKDMKRHQRNQSGVEEFLDGTEYILRIDSRIEIR